MKFDFESMEIQVQSPHQGKKCISPRNNDHIKTIGPRFQFTTRVKKIKGPWLCENHPNVNEFDEYERCADRKNQFISLSLSPLSVRREEETWRKHHVHWLSCDHLPKGPRSVPHLIIGSRKNNQSEKRINGASWLFKMSADGPAAASFNRQITRRFHVTPCPWTGTRNEWKWIFKILPPTHFTDSWSEFSTEKKVQIQRILIKF